MVFKAFRLYNFVNVEEGERCWIAPIEQGFFVWCNPLEASELVSR